MISSDKQKENMKISLSINPKIINRNEKKANPGIMTHFVQISTQDFVNKIIKKGIAWSAPKYKTTNRNKENFEQSHIIGIDIDKGLTLQKVFQDPFVQKNALLLYTSFRHTNKEHRFRLIFALKEIYPKFKEIENIIKQLISYFNADKACSDCCRLFYGNTNAKVKIFSDGNNYLNIEDLKTLQKNNNSNSNDNIPRNIEFKLRNKTQLNNMLKAIKSENEILEYQPWLLLCSSIWTIFSYDESIEVLQKYFPEEKLEDYKYKYEHRLSTIPYTYIIKLAIKAGFTFNEFSDFIRISDKGKITVSPKATNDFLNDCGFYTYFYNDDEKNYTYIRENKPSSNIIIETGIKKMSEFTKEYIEKNYNNFDTEQIIDYMLSHHIISHPKLLYLNSLQLDIHKDTVDSSFFYFQNGYLEIQKDNFLFHSSYENISPQKLWQDSIRAQKFDIDENESIFEKFLIKVSNEEKDRFESLCCVIGYLLHRFKNPNINKCVILNDEKINIDNPSGRTGKSLIAEALGYVRNLVTLDGRGFKYDDTFRFQNIELSTEIINMDDIPANFDLKKFYSILSGNLKVERKKEKSLLLPFSKSPKFIFSSNYTVDTGGASDRARVVEISLHNHYSDYYQPKHEFGHRFFYDWNQVEWNRFYTFFAKCIQKYFESGLLVTTSTKLLYNKIRKQTDEKFTFWVQQFDFFKENKNFYSKEELYYEYVNFAKQDFDYEPVSKNKFTRYMKTFFHTREIPYTEKCVRVTNVEIPIWGYEIGNY